MNSQRIKTLPSSRAPSFYIFLTSTVTHSEMILRKHVSSSDLHDHSFARVAHGLPHACAARRMLRSPSKL